MSRGKWIVTLIGVIVLALVIWRVVRGTHAGQPYEVNAAVPVTVVPAATENVPVYLAAHGTVQALNTVNVQPQVGGQLLKLDFAEGQPVKKGQVLAEIDPRTFQAQYQQAQAKQKQDEALLATAKTTLDRYENPQYKPYVAEIDRVTQRNNVRQLTAAVAADAAAARDAQVQLGYTSVLSPIDGLAGIRQVDPGNVVGTSTTIVTVTQIQPIYVIFKLAGTYLDEVRAAQAAAPLQVAIVSPDGKVIEGDGVLKVIDNQIDPDTGSFALKAEFPNPDRLLFPGQYVATRLQVGVDKDAVVVPTAAVQRGPNGEYVWLETDKPPAGSAGTEQSAQPKRGRRRPPGGAMKSASGPPKYVEMRSVTVGNEAGETHTIITRGLKPGDLVVTAGQFRLKQGSKVLALKPGEVPAPPTTAQIKAQEAQGGGRMHHG
jgi:membrane fusion protein, multidrug efflux system